MKIRWSMIVLLLVFAVSCAQPGSSPTAPASAGGSLIASQSTPLEATMRFGNDSVGSGFPTPSGHDQSGHARDNLIPRTVVIDRGGTVKFEMGGPVHQVGIFADGTEVGDIVRTNAFNKPGCPPVAAAKTSTPPTTPRPLSRSPARRCAIRPRPISRFSRYKFDKPGKYLVICTFIPHLDLAMYGWVVVRDR